MKVAWFSPLLPDHSDIANFTERLRGELQKRFELRLLAERRDGFSEPATGAFYPGELRSCPYNLLVSLNAGDLPIYNLGNNPAFFAQTWFLSQSKPGIVILHDLKLHHFFEGIFRERLGDEQSYLALLRRYHGPGGHAAGRAFLRGRVSINLMAHLFPMTAWAVQNALGVVVHTPYAYDEVRKITSTPVRMIPLPYDAQVSRRAAHLAGTDGAGRVEFSADRRVKVIIFGYLNVNRRIVEFLHALATMPERTLFEVHIVGIVFHAHEVNAAVEWLGLRRQVTFYDYVPDGQLEKLLGEADLAVNLRYPTMGEASGSQLRIWDHALPSLVTRSDGYASLPPETVFFVRPQVERADIQRHLRFFLRQPRQAREMGLRGRQWLLDHHQPSMYAEALGPFCEAAGALRSRQNRIALAERVGRAIAPWAAAAPASSRERDYAARIAELV